MWAFVKLSYFLVPQAELSYGRIFPRASLRIPYGPGKYFI
ncbi:Hypothetical protein Cp1002B_1027 [Corynebacterium pseudotuberculosis]|nr:Hypothetical protein CpPAT10_1627a [Corynebacterium pseudotuberculosis PAT10]AFF22780.1 Hypothetical protein CpP54B96_1656 [Corynebacterium pseudotuberculosis P54B96]AJC14362.1 Hypothetical protein CpVD57_1660 [Corynebacterium pseudotuberculosis]AKJ56305.1 Hypothetical protein Cp12C_1713 [Corynebacterium pseudotuberculosis]ALM77585.1 Hypothetical protein Cp1002B_1027 [Corynebacterium pseudotuberculosis]